MRVSTDNINSAYSLSMQITQQTKIKALDPYKKIHPHQTRILEPIIIEIRKETKKENIQLPEMEKNGYDKIRIEPRWRINKETTLHK